MSTLLTYKDELLEIHHVIGFYKAICDELFKVYPDATVINPVHWLADDGDELEFNSPSFTYEPEHFVIMSWFSGPNQEEETEIVISGHVHLHDTEYTVSHVNELLAKVTYAKKAKRFMLQPLVLDLLTKPNYASIKDEFKKDFFSVLMAHGTKPGKLAATKELRQHKEIQDLIEEFEQVKIFK